jgi:hypothetical protein
MGRVTRGVCEKIAPKLLKQFVQNSIRNFFSVKKEPIKLLLLLQFSKECPNAQ